MNVQALFRDAGRAPYSAALTVLARQAPQVYPGTKVWARNSYLTEAFRPFRSDLDVTLWLPRTPNREAAGNLRALMARLKRWFPALGEANVYCEDSFMLAAPWANFFELSRDPLTEEKLAGRGIRLRGRTPEKSAYLLRMLEANAKTLTHGWGPNRKKWSEHLSRVQVDGAAVLSDTQPIFGLLELALPGASREVREEAESYLRHGKESTAVQLLFPHRFCFREFPRTRAEDPVLHSVFLAQAAWEVWGLYGQHLLYQDSRKITDHLGRLEVWMNASGNAGATTTQALRDLSEMILQGVSL